MSSNREAGRTREKQDALKASSTPEYLMGKVFDPAWLTSSS
jgi:hypothetical protein